MPLKDRLNGYLRPSRRFFGIPSPEIGDPDIGILGIPYDLTSSHTPGPRFGPDAIRVATDSERSHSYPLSLSELYSDLDGPLSARITIEDIGDLELGVQLPESVGIHISDASSILAKSKSALLFLGGDHYITYPIVKGLKRGTSRTIGLVYLDSHADFYQDMGGLTLSHASTVKRIISEDLVLVENFVGYDFRCALPDQKDELGKSACPTNLTEFEESVARVSENVDSLYISIDLDVLQPHLVPGVSHPESGGLSIHELVKALDICFRSRKVRYSDIVEFNPLLDNSQITSITARDIVKAIFTGHAYQNSFK